MSENHSHCILCNKLVQNIEFHKNVCLEHKKKLEEALDGQVNIDIVNTDPLNPSSAVTFCKVCAVYVNTDDFEAHISSKTHIALEMYLSDGEKPIIASEMSSSQQDVSIDGSENKENEEVTKENNLKADIITEAVDNVLHPGRKSEADIANMCQNKHEENEALSVEQRRSDIILTVKKAVDQMEEYFNYCKVCCMQYTNSEERDEHYNSSLHRENVERYKAAISNGKGVNDELSYCVICSKYILKSDFNMHIKGKKHLRTQATQLRARGIYPSKSRFFAEITAKFKDIVDSNTQEITQNVNTNSKTDHTVKKCAVNADTAAQGDKITGQNQQKIQANGQNNKDLNVPHEVAPTSENIVQKDPKIQTSLLNAITTVQNVQTKQNGGTNIPNKAVTSTITAEEKSWRYLTKETDKPNELLCRVCSVTFPNDIQDLKIHVLGRKHPKKYKTLLSNNNIVKVDLTKFSCKTCNVEVTSMNELDHINGRNHKNNILKIKKEMKQLVELPSMYHFKKIGDASFYCKVCACDVPNANANITEHLEGNIHKKNYIDLLESNGIKSWRTMSHYFSCMSCCVFLKPSLELDHIDIDHRQKVELFEVCSLCDAAMCSDDASIARHMNSQRHRRAEMVDKNARVAAQST